MTRSVTQCIPTLEREERWSSQHNYDYRTHAPPGCAVLDALLPALRTRARRRVVTRSVTQGIPTLEREERWSSQHNYDYRARAPHGYAVLDALPPALSARTAL
ncbi:hypothetical protein KUIN1_37540 [Pseudomonas sp. KUIN-1]|nr:hypothetical protein KUIN1_37540 [Pseudomonas sp. KUIN-1]